MPSVHAQAEARQAPEGLGEAGEATQGAEGLGHQLEEGRGDDEEPGAHA